MIVDVHLPFTVYDPLRGKFLNQLFGSLFFDLPSKCPEVAFPAK